MFSFVEIEENHSLLNKWEIDRVKKKRVVILFIHNI